MVEYTPAEASNLTKATIQSFAEDLAEELGYEFDGDIHETVRDAGGRIVVKDILLSDPKSTGSLFVDDEEDFKIIVPAHTSSKRDVFTIAHEFGHYMVHYLVNKQGRDDFPAKVCAYRKGSDRIEWEANWFAAAFLMPEQRFRDSFARHNGSIHRVAEEFGVSTRAAEVRAQDLRLVE